MSDKCHRFYKLAHPMHSSSLSVVPTLSTNPKRIWFKVCKNRDRSIRSYVDIWDNVTYEQLKREIYKQLSLATEPQDFSLSVFDIDKNSWIAIDEKNLHNKIDTTQIHWHATLSIEKFEHTDINQPETSTIDSSELCLKLCRRPKYKLDMIDIKIKSSATLGQLKTQAQKELRNQETHNLYLWSTTDGWSILHLDLDNVPLAQLEFSIDSIISFGTESDPVPGVCGLTNLGNTCFMNSALQCLSNIPQLTREVLSFDEAMNAPVIGAYRKLIKTIWSGEHTVTIPSSLLINIREDLPRFTRYRQHDAQESMNYFLHVIHQELTSERTLITDLFHGQIQSTVKCLGGCKSIETNKETISFLPLPIDNDINQCEILFLRKNGEQCLRSVRTDGRTIGTLIQSFIQQHASELLSTQIKAVNLVDNCIRDEYPSNTPISDRIKSNLTFIEVSEKTAEQKYVKLRFINQQTRKVFRPPLFLVGPYHSCRYSHLSDQIDLIRDYLCSITDAPTSACHVYRFDTNNEGLELSIEKHNDEMIFLSDRLIIEMDSRFVDLYVNRYNVQHAFKNPSLNTLLSDFFREELLNGDYHCSECSALKKAKQKADLILPLPHVLIIQLKRFTYDTYSDAKIETLIDFPLQNLDLSEYITKDDQKNGKMLALYDLVAVSNHTGALFSGHYTTYARNYRTKKWYSFNNEITREITDEQDIVTKNAYILVYVKQNA